MGADTAPPEARFDRADCCSVALTSFLSLAIYLFTSAPNVTLGFSGILSTAAFYGGVALPAGYPAWTIYSWLFTRSLPFSNIAWRVGVGSAVAAALASAIVALIVSSGTKLLMEGSADFKHLTSAHRTWLRIVCGYVAGMALGLSGAVWGAAVIVDVWTLGLVLFTAILCLTLRWLMQPGRKRFLCAAFLLFGLLLTGNQEADRDPAGLGLRCHARRPGLGPRPGAYCFTFGFGSDLMESVRFVDGSPTAFELAFINRVWNLCRRWCGDGDNHKAIWLDMEICFALQYLICSWAVALLLPAACFHDQPAGQFGLPAHGRRFFPCFVPRSI